MIDLHSHTTASDGQHAPAELIRLAHEAGVTVLAVTDHDTVAGLDACDAAAKVHGLTVVPGIEVSAFINKREIHILGHFVDRHEQRLANYAVLLKAEREKRMELMVEKVQKLGFPVTMDHVRQMAGPDSHLARPHLARVMVEGGWCSDTKNAFNRFLGDGRPAAVPRYEVSSADAIALIRGAGGVATVAHPGVNKLEKFELEQLKAEGLTGLEVEHSDHPPSLREKFHAWARELDLIATAGSDFHGEAVAPGRKLGTASMNPERFAELRARSAAR